MVYDYHNSISRDPNYLYVYNVQTARYFQDLSHFNKQGLIKFRRNINKNLIPVDPTFLQEVYTNYTKYSSKISKSTTIPYNNMMVHKIFDKDTYYIGNEDRYIYWNVLPDQEKYSMFLYYLSTEGKALTRFKNIYYDSFYDDTKDINSNMTQYYKNNNSPKNMDLISEKQQFSDFYSKTCKNERKNRTEFFLLCT